jgi:hypothetical protein
LVDELEIARKEYQITNEILTKKYETQKVSLAQLCELTLELKSAKSQLTSRCSELEAALKESKSNELSATNKAELEVQYYCFLFDILCMKK